MFEAAEGCCGTNRIIELFRQRIDYFVNEASINELLGIRIKVLIKDFFE